MENPVDYIQIIKDDSTIDCEKLSNFDDVDDKSIIYDLNALDVIMMDDSIENFTENAELLLKKSIIYLLM